MQNRMKILDWMQAGIIYGTLLFLTAILLLALDVGIGQSFVTILSFGVTITALALGIVWIIFAVVGVVIMLIGAIIFNLLTNKVPKFSYAIITGHLLLALVMRNITVEAILGALFVGFFYGIAMSIVYRYFKLKFPGGER